VHVSEPKNRTKDIFSKAIENAKNNSEGTGDKSPVAYVIKAAFGDLILNSNTDMVSYIYLISQAQFALSTEVKAELASRDLGNNGAVALGLVTELVATGSKEDIYMKAVQPRPSVKFLSGIEALNEAYIAKFYFLITPLVQTQAVLMNNGIKITPGSWSEKLVKEAPTIDKIIQMDYSTLRQNVNLSTPGLRSMSEEDDLSVPISTPSPHEMQVVHELFSGMIDGPVKINVPAIRKQIFSKGLDMAIAAGFEEVSFYLKCAYSFYVYSHSYISKTVKNSQYFYLLN